MADRLTNLQKEDTDSRQSTEESQICIYKLTLIYVLHNIHSKLAIKTKIQLPPMQGSVTPC